MNTAAPAGRARPHPPGAQGPRGSAVARKGAAPGRPFGPRRRTDSGSSLGHGSVRPGTQRPRSGSERTGGGRRGWEQETGADAGVRVAGSGLERGPGAEEEEDEGRRRQRAPFPTTEDETGVGAESIVQKEECCGWCPRGAATGRRNLDPGPDHSPRAAAERRPSTQLPRPSQGAETRGRTLQGRGRRSGGGRPGPVRTGRSGDVGRASPRALRAPREPGRARRATPTPRPSFPPFVAKIFRSVIINILLLRLDCQQVSSPGRRCPSTASTVTGEPESEPKLST